MLCAFIYHPSLHLLKLGHSLRQELSYSTRLVGSFISISQDYRWAAVLAWPLHVSEDLNSCFSLLAKAFLSQPSPQLAGGSYYFFQCPMLLRCVDIILVPRMPIVTAMNVISEQKQEVRNRRCFHFTYTILIVTYLYNVMMCFSLWMDIRTPYVLVKYSVPLMQIILYSIVFRVIEEVAPHLIWLITLPLFLRHHALEKNLQAKRLFYLVKIYDKNGLRNVCIT